VDGYWLLVTGTARHSFSEGGLLVTGYLLLVPGIARHNLSESGLQAIHNGYYRRQIACNLSIVTSNQQPVTNNQQPSTFLHLPSKTSRLLNDRRFEIDLFPETTVND
jgi:hypothetical protein